MVTGSDFRDENSRRGGMAMSCAKQCLYTSVVSLLLGPISALSHADQPEAVRVTEHELWQALDLKRPALER